MFGKDEKRKKEREKKEQKELRKRRKRRNKGKVKLEKKRRVGKEYLYNMTALKGIKTEKEALEVPGEVLLKKESQRSHLPLLMMDDETQETLFEPYPTELGLKG